MAVEDIALLTISLLSISNSGVAQNFEAKVMNGEKARVTDFPHSVFLNVECKIMGDIEEYACGASVLNQRILITAGHCLGDCLKNSFVIAYVGNNQRYQGVAYVASGFKVHEKYDTDLITNDIALVHLDFFVRFAEKVRRVALLKQRLYDHEARVAGWGSIDNHEEGWSWYLMQTSQKIWNRLDCIQMLKRLLPHGVICGGDIEASNFITQGDSGSALVIDDFIQVGVVSFKIPASSVSLAVYTEIAYFYDWIRNNAKILYCTHGRGY